MGVILTMQFSWTSLSRVKGLKLVKGLGCGALVAPPTDWARPPLVEKGACLQDLWATWNELGQTMHLWASAPPGLQKVPSSKKHI